MQFQRVSDVFLSFILFLRLRNIKIWIFFLFLDLRDFRTPPYVHQSYAYGNIAAANHKKYHRKTAILLLLFF